jgi:hypothetical protein
VTWRRTSKNLGTLKSTPGPAGGLLLAEGRNEQKPNTTSTTRRAPIPFNDQHVRQSVNRYFIGYCKEQETSKTERGRLAHNEPSMNRALDMAPAQPSQVSVGQITGIPVLQSTQS